MEDIYLNFNNFIIINDIHYKNFTNRLNWDISNFIQNELDTDEDYKNIYKMNLNNNINKLIEYYMKIDTRKKGYREKYSLMIQIDDELSEIWN